MEKREKIKRILDDPKYHPMMKTKIYVKPNLDCSADRSGMHKNPFDANSTNATNTTSGSGDEYEQDPLHKEPGDADGDVRPQCFIPIEYATRRDLYTLVLTPGTDYDLTRIDFTTYILQSDFYAAKPNPDSLIALSNEVKDSRKPDHATFGKNFTKKEITDVMLAKVHLL